MIHKELSNKTINAFFKVYNTLGHGFLEKVYHNAMILELEKRALDFESEYHVEVIYEGTSIGHYIADIIVDGKLILELKNCARLSDSHKCQLMNYLRATNIELGLLFNFGKTPEFKRVICTNDWRNTNSLPHREPHQN
jgi:GxxExxY protein